jgi:hypothetical protein
MGSGGCAAALPFIGNGKRGNSAPAAGLTEQQFR